MNQKSRRNFVKLSGLALATAMVPSNRINAETLKKTNKLKLGLASYSLRKFSQVQAFDMTKRVGLDYICLKSMHLAMDAPLEELKKSASNAKNAGVELYGAGVIYMKNTEQVDQAFEYAKNAGMSVIVGVPAHDLLNYTNNKIKEYNIKVAIHNHGPGDDQYPSPESVFEKIKDLDPRFGLCMDIGHTQRIGVDPIEAGKEYFSRLFDIHLKDVNLAAPEGKTIEIGRGVIDIPGFLEMLLNKGYNGIASIEYEKDADDPLPGLSESVGYVKGCIKVLTQ